MYIFIIFIMCCCTCYIKWIYMDNWIHKPNRQNACLLHDANHWAHLQRSQCTRFSSRNHKAKTEHAYIILHRPLDKNIGQGMGMISQFTGSCHDAFKQVLFYFHVTTRPLFILFLLDRVFQFPLYYAKPHSTGQNHMFRAGWITEQRCQNTYFIESKPSPRLSKLLDIAGDCVTQKWLPFNLNIGPVLVFAWLPRSGRAMCHFFQFLPQQAALLQDFQKCLQLPQPALVREGFEDFKARDRHLLQFVLSCQFAPHPGGCLCNLCEQLGMTIRRSVSCVSCCNSPTLPQVPLLLEFDFRNKGACQDRSQTSQSRFSHSCQVARLTWIHLCQGRKCCDQSLQGRWTLRWYV